MAQAAQFLRNMSSGVLDEFSGLRGRKRAHAPERTPQEYVASHIDDYNGRGQYSSGLRTHMCTIPYTLYPAHPNVHYTLYPAHPTVRPLLHCAASPCAVLCGDVTKKG